MNEINNLIMLAGISNSVTAIALSMTLICLVFGFIMLAYTLGGFGTAYHEEAGFTIFGLSMFFGIVFAITAAVFPNQQSLYVAAGINAAKVLNDTSYVKNLDDAEKQMIHDLGIVLHNYALPVMMNNTK